LDLNFAALLVDSSLFTFHLNVVHLFLLIYVHEIIVIVTDSSLINSLITCMQQEFPFKDLGPLNFFLGIQVHRTAAGLHLSQSKYITDLLLQVNIANAKLAKSPCPSGLKLSWYDGEPLSDLTAYRQVIGALLYCTLTRLEITFSMNQLC
jgi:hypothetical protein